MPVQCTHQPLPFTLLLMLMLLALLPTQGRLDLVVAFDPPGDDPGSTTGLGTSDEEGDQAS
jgi:hypothetical protein